MPLVALVFCRLFFCSCIGTATPAESFSRAQAVAVGRVITIEHRKLYPVSRRDSLLSLWYPVRATLVVDARWKGPAADTLEVYTGLGSGDCGYPFAVGQAYLLYADSMPGNYLATSICDRTRPLARATDDLSVLGSPVWRRAPVGP